MGAPHVPIGAHDAAIVPVTVMSTRLPIKDAAEMLGVSIDTVRRRLRRGDLTGEFVDGRWLVDIQDPPEAQGLSGISHLAMRLVSEEVEHLRAENARLLGIIEVLAERDPKKRSLLDGLRS